MFLRNLDGVEEGYVFQKIGKLDKRIIEVDSSKERPAIIVAGKPTGDFGQRASKSIDLVEDYIQKLDWRVKENSNMCYSLDLQDELQTKYTGGTVLHIYLEEQVGDAEAIKALIRKVVTHYRLPYFTLTPTFSVCPSHGYLNGEKARCLFCDGETEVYSRVVGYLRPVKRTRAYEFLVLNSDSDVAKNLENGGPVE